MAQSLFSPAIRINDRAITWYEIDQREEFLRLLRAPGDLRKTAIEQLIDDRLRRDAAADMDIRITEEETLEAMSEFASRTELTREQFVQELEQGGVDEETYRDFVISGVLWREVVRARFGPRAQVSEAEVDRALALSSRRGGARVLLSEIVLPARPGERAEAEAVAADLKSIRGFDAFANAARQLSAAPSRNAGGRIEWIPIGNLPPQIAAQLLTLAPGQVTDPIRTDQAIIVFQLRALEEVDAPPAQAVAVDYARFLIPGGRSPEAYSEAARIAAETDTCDDLYGIAQGKPEEWLDRVVLPSAQVPADIAVELAKLDENEVSTALTTADGGALVFLMLCGRTLELTEDVSRDDVRRQLVNARVASYADSYLSELRAEAFIVYEDESLRP